MLQKYDILKRKNAIKSVTISIFFPQRIVVPVYIRFNLFGMRGLQKNFCYHASCASSAIGFNGIKR
jgi:hypothetical protein